MKPRVIAILLAIFLGWLGIHRFYMNRPGSGIIYILFCWTVIPAIVALVEALLLLLTTDDEFEKSIEHHDEDVARVCLLGLPSS